jgi:hypothetical protein
MDPSVGAGSFGIAAFWQIVSQGADLIAWATVVLYAAPRIRDAAKKMTSLMGYDESDPAVSFSPAALRVLVVADVISHNGLEPAQIVDVQMLRHTYAPVEPREELRYLYAAYTVSVSAFVEDHYCTWVYVVTPDAQVVSQTNVRVPIPNRSHWTGARATSRSLLE